jgi:hypothetical protein
MFLVAACGTASNPTATPAGGGATGTGHVHGSVLAWPCAPVERAGSPCPGRPAPGVRLRLQSSAGFSAETTTDASGGYALDVPPGDYVASLPDGRRTRGEAAAHVAAGEAVELNVVFDSGIR